MPASAKADEQWEELESQLATAVALRKATKFEEALALFTTVLSSAIALTAGNEFHAKLIPFYIEYGLCLFKNAVKSDDFLGGAFDRSTAAAPPEKKVTRYLSPDGGQAEVIIDSYHAAPAAPAAPAPAPDASEDLQIAWELFDTGRIAILRALDAAPTAATASSSSAAAASSSSASSSAASSSSAAAGGGVRTLKLQLADIHTLLGDVLGENDGFDLAMEEYRKAADIFRSLNEDKKLAQALIFLACAGLFCQQHAPALAAYEEVAEVYCAGLRTSLEALHAPPDVLAEFPLTWTAPTSIEGYVKLQMPKLPSKKLFTAFAADASPETREIVDDAIFVLDTLGDVHERICEIAANILAEQAAAAGGSGGAAAADGGLGGVNPAEFRQVLADVTASAAGRGSASAGPSAAGSTGGGGFGAPSSSAFPAPSAAAAAEPVAVLKPRSKKAAAAAASAPAPPTTTASSAVPAAAASSSSSAKPRDSSDRKRRTRSPEAGEPVKKSSRKRRNLSE